MIKHPIRNLNPRNQIIILQRPQKKLPPINIGILPHRNNKILKTPVVSSTPGTPTLPSHHLRLSTHQYAIGSLEDPPHDSSSTRDIHLKNLP